MLRLLPIERIVQQLPKTLVGGDGYQHPVAERGQAIGNEIEPPAPDRRQHVEKDEGAVAGQKIEQGKKQQRFRKHCLKAAERGDEPTKIKQPEYRIEQS